MNNAVGAAQVEAMLRGGIPVCLGNDGFSNDMFTEMKVADLLQKLARQDPRSLGADKVIQMAVNNNRALAATFFDKPVGLIAPGAFADLILLDYYPTTPLKSGEFALAYSVWGQRRACPQHDCAWAGFDEESGIVARWTRRRLRRGVGRLLRPRGSGIGRSSKGQGKRQSAKGKRQKCVWLTTGWVFLDGWADADRRGINPPAGRGNPMNRVGFTGIFGSTQPDSSGLMCPAGGFSPRRWSASTPLLPFALCLLPFALIH